MLCRNYNGIYSNGFVFIRIVFKLLVGWPIYLISNGTGGRIQSDLETRLDPKLGKSHFSSRSQVMKKDMGSRIRLSTAGCVATLATIAYFGRAGLYYYVGPYLIVNAWLVTYMLLQHTHPMLVG